jgi:hypothetical protein
VRRQPPPKRRHRGVWLALGLAGVRAMRLETTTTAPNTGWPGVLICLLGTFQVLKTGQPFPLWHGGKVAALLTACIRW